MKLFFSVANFVAKLLEKKLATKLAIRISQKVIYRIILLLVLFIFIFANLLAWRIDNLFNLRLDFTGEKLYSLSPATQNAISALDKNSNTFIYIITSEDAYPPALKELLRRYSALSPSINISYITPHADPVFINRFARDGFVLSEFDILVEGANGTRHILATEIARQDSRGRITGLFLEERLTNAILLVNSSRTYKAAFTVGRGERPQTLMTDIFSSAGFSTQTLALMAGQLPDADVVVIAGAERDFLPNEIDTLKNYLQAGGSLMVFIAPSDTKFVQLENFLAEYGLTVLSGIINEARAHTPGNAASIIPMYGAHEINMTFAQRQYFLAMPAARPLMLAEDTNVNLTRLLFSTRDSFTIDGADAASSGVGVANTGGPSVLAALAEKAEKNEGKIMLFGSTEFFAQNITSTEAYANREYLVRAALWLSGAQTNDLVSIPPKTFAPPRINVSFGTALFVLIIFAVILPLVILATGIVTLAKRRRR
jgi:ABC-type uncharacterized transport system involved in gliding motility auxiliary subunit